MFWLLIFVLGKTPNILDINYKIEHTFDHNANFREDRPPTEVGHRKENRKRKEKRQQNNKPAGFRAT